MPGNPRSGVFLSYARADGEHFAAALRDRLRTHAPDIDIKQDRNLLEGGVGWWKQLTDAIESVEFLVLVMTPSAMQSDTVRKEWRYARQQGVCVYPVKAAPDSELKFSALPHWMRKAHFFDIDKEWESFLGHLRKGCDSPRVPFMAPDLPENFVQREEEFGKLKNLLLSADRKESVAITTALSGAGGFGKTTLAAALCHDEDIIQNFDDGILWVTLGQNPNVMSGLVTAYAALTGDRPGFASEEDAAFQLGQKLEDRTCLFVIDDVWDESHLRPFLRGGKGSARLFTTRNAEIASSKAQPVRVDEMSSAESQALIAKGVPGLTAAHARELAQRLGEWPIALEIAAAMMRQRIEQGDSAERSVQRLLQILDKKGPSGLVKGTGAHRTIDSVLQGSLELLTEEDHRRLTELCIFPEDISIPLAAAASLWRLDEFEAEETAQRFARLYLLKLDLAKGSMRLHDVMHDWLASATSNAPELHSRLVDSWPDWMNLPNTYAWLWLTWHLAKAGRKAEIENLLWNPLWLKAKLSSNDISTLIAGFEFLKPSPEAELVQGALRLSSHVLARDPSQFASQMTGRLLPHASHSGIQRFIEALPQAADQPWLRPLWPTLDPPGTGLLRTLTGHADWVMGVAVTPDGRRAISASADCTLKVWDLETGAELRILAGHSGGVKCVAVSADGRQVVSASADTMVKVWDLESGAELRTLAGHTSQVNGVAISADGRRAVSASWDTNLKVWNLESGAELRTLSGHLDGVNGVALTADGRLAISASSDLTLKVWDLDNGSALHTLIGHTFGVNSVAVSAKGRAVSASNDQTIKIWDLENGAELDTLAGHNGVVQCVVVSADERRAVSASWDNTLKVWDLGTGSELRTLAGHSSWVNSVALSADGRAVSASSDKTLKVWDLETGGKRRTLAPHSDGLNSVAVSPNGGRAVSASRDKTLKVWDLKNGGELRTLAGHTSQVNAVAMFGDGRRAVSASWDKTLRVWDLESGSELRTLAGHSDGINWVAVTSDGRIAVSASSDTTLKVWDLESGAELRTLVGHNDWVTGVAVITGKPLAISASRDNTLKVWDLKSGAELRSLTGHSDWVTGVVMSTDGRLAASASWDKTLKIWNLESGVEQHTLVGHSSWINGVGLSADSRIAISASEDNTIKVWDLEDGGTVATLTCDSAVFCCAFVDNSTILAGDEAGRLHLLALEFPQPR